MSSVNRDIFYFFLSNMYAFSSFSCPVALAGTSSAMLSEGAENGHHYTEFLILREDIQSFSINDDVNCREFLVDILYEIEKVPLYS